MSLSKSINNTQSNKLSNDVEKYSKCIVAAITNDVNLSMASVQQIELARIDNVTHKRIISVYMDLYEYPHQRPTPHDVAVEVLRMGQGDSDDDLSRLADAIEDGHRWGSQPNEIEIGVALNYLAVKQDVVSSGIVAFRDLHPTKRTPLGTYDNLETLLASLGVKPITNLMNLEQEIEIDGAITDMTAVKARSYLISEALKAGLTKSAVVDHLDAAYESDAYHPVRRWLDVGEWDGKARVADVIECLNAKNGDLASVAIRKWLVSCVAALYERNFTTKLVPVLQGEQSYMKTAYISRIAEVVDCAFLEGAELNPDRKDSVLSCIRSWITELGELERTSRNSQGSLKAFITKKIDVVRPQYAKTDMHKKRQTALIASVNGADFLRDATGSTRFAVIELAGAVDIERLNALLGWTYRSGRLSHSEPNKLKQFWLEVKHLFDSGEDWHLSSGELESFRVINGDYQYEDDLTINLRERVTRYDDSHNCWEWMDSAQICDYYEMPSTKTRVVGKALLKLANDGVIERKTGRSRKVFYRIPTVLPR